MKMFICLRISKTNLAEERLFVTMYLVLLPHCSSCYLYLVIDATKPTLVLKFQHGNDHGYIATSTFIGAAVLVLQMEQCFLMQ